MKKIQYHSLGIAKERKRKRPERSRTYQTGGGIGERVVLQS